MDLSDIIRKREIHIGRLAALMGYSRNYVNEVAIEKRVPSARFLKDLSRISLVDVTKKYAQATQRKENKDISTS
jgi:transcriptional regulator with XRE-family HTH domain